MCGKPQKHGKQLIGLLWPRVEVPARSRGAASYIAQGERYSANPGFAAPQETKPRRGVLLYCVRRIGMVVVMLSLTLTAGGCANEQVQYTQVELYGGLIPFRITYEYPVLLHGGEKVVIDNPRVATHLSKFFPGLGTGRKAWGACLCVPYLHIVFTDSSGKQVTVYIKEYRTWGSDVDYGDLGIRGDILPYLEALLTKADRQRAKTHPAIHPGSDIRNVTTQPTE